MKSPASFLLIIFLLLCLSCKHDIKRNNSFVPVFSTYKTDPAGKNNLKSKDEIFYGILTPVEICTIFNRLGIPHNKDILNPTSNSDLYLSNSKAAINTGVYGTDFGYLKLFGISQEMIDYIVTIREMSNKLGIPDNLINEAIKRVENDISEPDTIMFLINQAYMKIEAHLREGKRESTAGLMVMGGWIEAMYIATQLVYDPEKPDPQVVQKIAEQKYTLTSLLSFLKNYYDDPVVVYYTKKLKYLKNYFDSFDIYFKKGDLEIDTYKQVFRSSGTEMNVTVETLNKIRDYIGELRKEIVKT